MKITQKLGKEVKKISILVVFLLSGCDDNLSSGSLDIESVDIESVCAEMGSTTVGLSGPSKRMDIMKSYGIKPLLAVEIEQLLDSNAQMETMASKLDAALPNRAACWRKARRSCLLIVLAGTDDNEKVMATLRSDIISELASCSSIMS